MLLNKCIIHWFSINVTTRSLFIQWFWFDVTIITLIFIRCYYKSWKNIYNLSISGNFWWMNVIEVIMHRKSDMPIKPQKLGVGWRHKYFFVQSIYFLCSAQNIWSTVWCVYILHFTCDWFASFLKNRTQNIIIGKTLSDSLSYHFSF